MTNWLFEYSGYAVLLAFFTAFIGIVFWVYRPSNKDKIEQHRDIPFREAE